MNSVAEMRKQCRLNAIKQYACINRIATIDNNLVDFIAVEKPE